MTRLAVLSDIHANLPALEAVVQDLARFKVDRVIVAGDVINLGPFTQQAVERVIENGWTVIRGNGELFLLDQDTPRAPQAWSDPVEYPIPAWLNRQLDARLKTAIAGWPETIRLELPDAPPICVVHGTPASPWESLYPTLTDEDIGRFLSRAEEGTVIAGHTHLAMDRPAGRWHLLNPGSVGVPLDGDFTASYMLLDGDDRGWRPTFRRIPFDLEAVLREFERIGFVEECGAIGRLIVEVFRTARPQMTSFARWRAAQRSGQPASIRLLEEFWRTCKWWEYAEEAYRVNLP